MAKRDCWGFESSSFMGFMIRFFCTPFPADPLVNRLFIEPPHPPDAQGRDFSFGGILVDGHLGNAEIVGDFLGGHQFGHGLASTCSKWAGGTSSLGFIIILNYTISSGGKQSQISRAGR